MRGFGSVAENVEDLFDVKVAVEEVSRGHKINILYGLESTSNIMFHIIHAQNESPCSCACNFSIL